ncbi:MAG: hypothetical protein ACUVQ1_04005 [Candidatus Kapaibacteriales bacterium]
MRITESSDLNSSNFVITRMLMFDKFFSFTDWGNDNDRVSILKYSVSIFTV